MSDSLNRYLRTFGRLAPLRLCVSHPFCAETIGDLCNASVQTLRNEPMCSAGSSKLRYQRYPRNPRFNENYQTKPFCSTKPI
jgi:hypothetical protein